jgi:hypothetical protein
VYSKALPKPSADAIAIRTRQSTLSRAVE